MNLKLGLFVFLLLQLNTVSSQTNFGFDNPDFERLLLGNYPQDSFSTNRMDLNQASASWLEKEINADSMRTYLEELSKYHNRNTIADFEQFPEYGIRGARSYIASKLDQWNQQYGTSIIPAIFEFDYLMCGVTRHRELMAIVPGSGDDRNELVIIEAHLDSRCEGVCDTGCLANGAEDNGSGSVLLMELARVLSRFKTNRSLLFIWTTGEEQGLAGARAVALYCKQKNIKIKTVLNNDVVGGIECGFTSSSPGCPGPGQVDSLRLRIFSSGITNSMSKSQARLVKLIADSNLTGLAIQVPRVDIMFAEDRSGRGGDHIPFREQGYTSIRFTSSYEHGDGNPSQPNYRDRQHSSRDVLGKDLDGDGMLDSVFVNFTYLKKNALINAWTAAHAASIKAKVPEIQLSPGENNIKIFITNPDEYSSYFIGIRKVTSVYFDTLVKSMADSIQIFGLNSGLYYISVCGIDKNGWYSMIGTEYSARVSTHTSNTSKGDPIEVLQNRPNPFDEYSLIPIIVNDVSAVKSARLEITDASGIIIKSEILKLHEGINEFLLNTSDYSAQGKVYFYHLIINEKIRISKKMLYLAN